MQTQNPIFDQIAKLFTEAAGLANGAREEAETLFRRRLERLVADMDFVPREEFEALRDVAAAARAENDELKTAIEALEQRLSALEK